MSGGEGTAAAEAARETEAQRGPKAAGLAGHGFATRSQCDPGYQFMLPKSEMQASFGLMFLQNTRVQFLSLLLISLVTLSKLLNLSVSQFPHL